MFKFYFECTIPFLSKNSRLAKKSNFHYFRLSRSSCCILWWVKLFNNILLWKDRIDIILTDPSEIKLHLFLLPAGFYMLAISSILILQAFPVSFALVFLFCRWSLSDQTICWILLLVISFRFIKHILCSVACGCHEWAVAVDFKGPISKNYKKKKNCALSLNLVIIRSKYE